MIIPKVLINSVANALTKHFKLDKIMNYVFDDNELDKKVKCLEEKVELSAKDSDGIIIQLPLPEHINPEEAINKIPYNLDVDGLTALNLGNLYSEEYKIIPATSSLLLR